MVVVMEEVMEGDRKDVTGEPAGGDGGLDEGGDGGGDDGAATDYPITRVILDQSGKVFIISAHSCDGLHLGGWWEGRGLVGELRGK